MFFFGLSVLSRNAGPPTSVRCSDISCSATKSKFGRQGMEWHTFFFTEVLCLILAMAFIKALSTLIERFSIECNQRARVINLKDGEIGTRTEKQRD